MPALRPTPARLPLSGRAGSVVHPERSHEQLALRFDETAAEECRARRRAAADERLTRRLGGLRASLGRQRQRRRAIVLDADGLDLLQKGRPAQDGQPSADFISLTRRESDDEARVWQDAVMREVVDEIGDRIVAVNGHSIDANYTRGELWQVRSRPAGTLVKLTMASGDVRELRLADYY